MTIRSNTRYYIASTSALLLVLAISLAFPYPTQAREISVPLEAVKASKTERLSSWQLSRERVRVPINWVRQEWIEENFNGKVRVKVYDENYEPLNTSVLLEGDYEGMTGSDGEKLIDNLGPGNYYSIEVKKHGYRNESESVILDSGETQNLTFRLEEKIRKASIEVEVVDDTGEDLHAEVYLDGDYADDTSYYTGRTTIESVEPGHHDVTVKRDGYETETEYIHPSGGENVELTITLTKENTAPRADFSYSPSKPEVGETIEFESESVDPDGEIEGYSWSYGDYSSDYSQNTTHSYSSPGNYEVTLTVKDDSGSEDEISKTITVEERKGRLKINTLNQAGEALTVPVYLDGSREGLSWGGYYIFQDLRPVYHEIKIESDNYKKVVKNVKFPETGEKVVDIILEKPNQKPNAGFDFSPSDPKVGQTVKFEVESEDPDGEIVDYNWSFGDGSATSIKEPDHRYSRKGKFSVELTVTDDSGATDSVQKQIKVRQEKARLILRATDAKGESLKGSMVKLGEKNRGKTDKSGKLTISKLAPRTYSIKVSKEGYKTSKSEINLPSGETEEITVSLEEKNTPPKVDFEFTPDHPKTGEDVRFESTSADSDGEIVKLKWDFGEQGKATGSTVTREFRKSGDYTISLQGVDDDGATDRARETVKIRNRKPVASFRYTEEGTFVKQQVVFDASSSSDPDGSIESYNWDLDDDGINDASGKRVSRAYKSPGTYSIKLTVTDDNGESTSTSKEIEITEKDREENSVKIEDKYGLIIGISDYKHETINDLQYSRQDAKDFYDFLLSDKFGGFTRDNLTLLTDREATAEAIRREMSQLVMEVEKDDLVIIYFSGHGALGPDKNGDEREDNYDEYFVAYDTNNSSGAKLYSTGIRDDQFGNWLASMDSEQVAIFLDSCYSGGATKSSKGTSIPGQKTVPDNNVFNDFNFENDRLLFSASRENQPSWESQKLDQGVFTHFLLKGLQGAADKNDDGKIVAAELYRYLKPHVSNYVEDHFTSNQVPLMKGGITAPLAAEKGRLKGKVASIIGEDKKEAGSGDYVMLSIGQKDNVKKGDQFRVFLNTKAVGVVRKVHGVIEVIEVVGPHLSFAKVSKSKFMVEKGYKVVKMEKK